MKLITSSLELRQEFVRLTKSYPRLEWATAWAGAESEPLKALKSAATKIERLVVGLHFYQTHPEFIATFIKHPRVRFIKQPSGVFHPKVYLFYRNEREWELLVGSANFSAAAFSVNVEATLSVSWRDEGAATVFEDARKLIGDAWAVAKPFTASELDSYRIIWKNQKSKRDSLSGGYGKKKDKTPAPTPMHQVPVSTMTWKHFAHGVRNDVYSSVSSRIKLLAYLGELFVNHPHFDAMSTLQRRDVAGLHNPIDDTAGSWFGSMRGAGKFANKIVSNDQRISMALDQIPLSGELTKSHYEDFIAHYEKALPGNFLATATRLLAMKRPDTFVCLDSRNKQKLCSAFGIQSTGMDYQRYWDEIVMRIRDCDWWLNPKPASPMETKIADGRAAFLDSLYYKH